MRRKHLEAGDEFIVAQTGHIARVVEPDAGWVLISGEWVQRPEVKRRRDKSGVGYENYPSNRRIRVKLVGQVDEESGDLRRWDRRKWRKAVEYPRNLVTFEEYAARSSQEASTEKSRVRAEREVQRALRAAGLARAEVDVETRTVTVGVDDLLRVLPGGES